MKITHLLENFKLFKKSRNRILVPLLEMSIEQIYMFTITGNPKTREEVMDYFELEYELEYKYSMMKNNPFKGLP